MNDPGTVGTALRWGSATHAGTVRARNEDTLLAAFPVFVVADGMGGHAAGDVASGLVVEAFAPLVGRHDVRPGEVAPLVAEANDAVLESALAGGTEGMGSTVVALVLVHERHEDHLLVLNVGDSRVYRCTPDGLRQVTVDHSYVQELVDAGHLTAEDAGRHPERNVVTRAFGAREAPRPDVWLLPPRPGERFVLCSDGLTTEVDDDGVARVLGAHADPQAAADALVEAAVSAGGRDNVSVVVVDVVGRDVGRDGGRDGGRDVGRDGGKGAASGA